MTTEWFLIFAPISFLVIYFIVTAFGLLPQQRVKERKKLFFDNKTPKDRFEENLIELKKKLETENWESEDDPLGYLQGFIQITFIDVIRDYRASISIKTHHKQ